MAPSYCYAYESLGETKEKFLILFGIWTPLFLSLAHSSNMFLRQFRHYHLLTPSIEGKVLLLLAILLQISVTIHLYKENTWKLSVVYLKHTMWPFMCYTYTVDMMLLF
jgi:hypothetical protein